MMQGTVMSSRKEKRLLVATSQTSHGLWDKEGRGHGDKDREEVKNEKILNC